MKQLIVNADDFGFTSDVNSGIIEAHARGILTATTLMANGSAFANAVSLAKQHPTLDVGCHLVLVQGQSLSRPGQRLPQNVRSMIQAVFLKKIDPIAEFRAQIEKILASGISPQHLDTHKHTHLFPPVLDAVARLSQEYRIRWVRRPFDLPLGAGHVPRSRVLLSRSLQFVRSQFHRKLSRFGCRTTDHFAGFQITGRFRTAELTALLEALPSGVTELMTHPGHCTAELAGTTSRLKQSREEELEALCSPETRKAVRNSGIRLVRFHEL